MPPTDGLERIVEHSPTLRQELSNSIHAYPHTWVEYFKAVGPAIVISSVASSVGQWAITELGYDSKAATTASAYVCGYLPGYSYFFLSEYHRHREHYGKLFSKKFGEFVGTFLAADYVADLTTFTPAFIAANVWMTDHTDFHPVVRGMLAWNGAALLYVSSISALHPLSRRINTSLNKRIRSLFHRLNNKSQE